MLQVALIRICYMVVMFLASIVLSNLALPEKFGTISFLILNASLLSLVTGLGTDSMILFKVSNKQWSISQAFHFAYKAIIMQVVVFLLLELVCLFLFQRTALSQENVSYLFIDAAYFIGLVITEKYISLFYSANKSKIANIILIIVSVAYLLLLLTVYYFVDLHFSYVLYLFALQSLVQGIVLIIFFSYGSLQKNKIRNQEFIRAIGLSSVVMFTNVIQLMAYRIDFWFLKYFYNNYEVGIYAQANKFANLSWVIPNIIAHLLTPKFAGLDSRRIRELFSAGFYLNLIVIAVTVVCTELFYRFYLQPEYDPGLSAFYAMLPGYFFWGTVIYFGAYVSASGKFLYNLIGSSFCFAIILIADILLIPSYGIKGAAWSNSIAYTAVFFIYLLIFRKKFAFNMDFLTIPSMKTWSGFSKI